MSFNAQDYLDAARALERGLNDWEMGRIALILPFTPVEMAMRREELALEENGVRRTARVRSS